MLIIVFKKFELILVTLNLKEVKPVFGVQLKALKTDLGLD